MWFVSDKIELKEKYNKELSPEEEKNKDDKISKEFYYLGRMEASGKYKEFTMANTDKKAVEIEWNLDVPVRDDIYEYITSA